MIQLPEFAKLKLNYSSSLFYILKGLKSYLLKKETIRHKTTPPTTTPTDTPTNTINRIPLTQYVFLQLNSKKSQSHIHIRFHIG